MIRLSLIAATVLAIITAAQAEDGTQRAALDNPPPATALRRGQTKAVEQQQEAASVQKTPPALQACGAMLTEAQAREYTKTIQLLQLQAENEALKELMQSLSAKKDQPAAGQRDAIPSR